VRDTINARLVLDKKSERKTSLGIPKPRFKDIRMGFKETGLEWINSAPEKDSVAAHSGGQDNGP
jgi:hypothetical protein